MSRIIPLVAALSLLSVVNSAQAQWFGTSNCEKSCWQRYWDGFRENNQWPKQWIGYDRAAVCTPLDLMAEKGWHRMNLIGSYHFDPATNQLNKAGEHKVWYILNQQLPERRTVFVERGTTPAETTERMDAVQQVATRMLPTGELPQVVDTNMILEGSPAADVDATLRGFARTRPDPRLPAASSEASNVGENGP
jgi:hypothetical protein